MSEAGEGSVSIEVRLGSVEEKLGSVEVRLGSVEGSLGSVEERLGSVENQVTGLRGEVDGLRLDVQKLRVLEEANAATIKFIAENHGAKLDQLAQDLQPLREMRDFVRLVADNHERRISALEERGG